MQVLKTLLPSLADALARKDESGSLKIQAEQYLESILKVNKKNCKYKCV